jgi:hypothetical protein
MSVRSIIFAHADTPIAAVSVVASINGNTYASGVSTFLITTTAATQIGDVVYIFAHATTTRSYVNTTLVVAGSDVGTLLFNRTDNAVNNTRLVCVRVTAATAGVVTYRLNWNGTATGCIKAVVTRSVLGQTVSPSTNAAANPVSYSVPAPQVTVASANSLLLNAYAVNSVNNGDAITLPVGLTAIGSSLNSGAGSANARLLHAGYQLNPALGLSGTNIATYASTLMVNSVAGTVVAT